MGKDDIVDYELVFDSDIGTLEALVRGHLKAGWFLFAPPFMLSEASEMNEYIVQPMIRTRQDRAKYEEQDDAKR